MDLENNYHVLIIDDEKNLTLILSEILKRGGLSSQMINDSINKHSEMLLDPKCGAVLLDLFMPDQNGLDLLIEIKKSRPFLPVVMMTAYGTIELAVHALKAGAFDFITKPFDQDDVLMILQKALKTYEASQKEISFSQYRDITHEEQEYGNELLFSEGVLSKIKQMSTLESHVFIQGEIGLGKDSIALKIHQNSPRSLKPFIQLNAMTLSNDLLEKELFGFQSGAFSGSLETKPGKIELAHQGTLFLDEIHMLSLDLQQKLFKVLKEQQVERVGSTHSLFTDVRFIVSTSKNIEKKINEGLFLPELFELLNVFHMRVPSLKERKESIPKLILYFNEALSVQLQKNKISFSDEAMYLLTHFLWPGNLKQMENFIGQMLFFNEGQHMDVHHLPYDFQPLPTNDVENNVDQDLSDFKEHVKSETQKVELNLIKKALYATEGNITQAAQTLGLSRKGLQLKMKELGLRKEASE